MNYKDGKTLGKIFDRLMELRKVYYVDAFGVVKVKWNGKWTSYHEVMLLDEDLYIEEE